jgi:LacI family transcriptional regulator
VDVDNYSGATLAVEHLVSLGHKKIGFIMNCNNILACSQDRFRGYRDVLARNGIGFDDSMTETGDLSIRGGYEAMISLLRKNSDITAVFIAADMMAIGAIKAIKDSGKRVPEDISVIGFDDIPESEYADPPLTTIRQPGAGKGEKAAHLLINLLEKKIMMKSVLLDIELQKRKSTSSPCK